MVQYVTWSQDWVASNVKMEVWKTALVWALISTQDHAVDNESMTEIEAAELKLADKPVDFGPPVRNPHEIF